MDIGRKIKEVWDVYKVQHCMTLVAFAKQICVERRSLYHVFKRRNIDVQLLKRISLALEHDFFKDLSDDLTRTVDEQNDSTPAENPS